MHIINNKNLYNNSRQYIQELNIIRSYKNLKATNNSIKKNRIIIERYKKDKQVTK